MGIKSSHKKSDSKKTTGSNQKHPSKPSLNKKQDPERRKNENTDLSDDKLMYEP